MLNNHHQAEKNKAEENIKILEQTLKFQKGWSVKAGKNMTMRDQKKIKDFVVCIFRRIAIQAHERFIITPQDQSSVMLVLEQTNQSMEQNKEPEMNPHL